MQWKDDGDEGAEAMAMDDGECSIGEGKHWQGIKSKQ
jgi:hypothetical protein